MTMLSDDEMDAIARGNIERNFDPQDDDYYEEAYVLAFDALHDAGVDNETAARVASGIAAQMTGV